MCCTFHLALPKASPSMAQLQVKDQPPLLCLGKWETGVVLG